MADDDFASFRNHYAVGKSGETVEPRSSVSRVLEVILWLAIIGTVASLAIPDFAGRTATGNALITTMTGLALWTYLLGRVRRSPRAWLYPVIGVVLLFGLFFAAGVTRGVKVRSAEEDLLAALEKFEPATAAQARAAGKDTVRMKAVMQPAMYRAALRVPDANIIDFRDTMYTVIETPAGLNRQRCIDVATGHMSAAPTREETLILGSLMIRLFTAAAGRPVPERIDAERAQTLHDRALKAADPDGKIVGGIQGGTAKPDDICDLYRLIMREQKKMPPADAALVMRWNIARTVGGG